MKKPNLTDAMINHLLIIYKELHEMVNLLEQKKEARLGAVIGGRIQILSNMFRTYNKQKNNRIRFDKIIKELDEQQENFIKERNEMVNKPFNTKKFQTQDYMG